MIGRITCEARISCWPETESNSVNRRIGDVGVGHVVVETVSWKVEIEGIVARGYEAIHKVVEAIGPVIEEWRVVELELDFVKKGVDVVRALCNVALHNGGLERTFVGEGLATLLVDGNVGVALGCAEKVEGGQKFYIGEFHARDVLVDAGEPECKERGLRVGYAVAVLAVDHDERDDVAVGGGKSGAAILVLALNIGRSCVVGGVDDVS